MLVQFDSMPSQRSRPPTLLYVIPNKNLHLCTHLMAKPHNIGSKESHICTQLRLFPSEGTGEGKLIKKGLIWAILWVFWPKMGSNCQKCEFGDNGGTYRVSHNQRYKSVCHHKQCIHSGPNYYYYNNWDRYVVTIFRNVYTQRFLTPKSYRYIAVITEKCQKCYLIVYFSAFNLF